MTFLRAFTNSLAETSPLIRIGVSLGKLVDRIIGV